MLKLGLWLNAAFTTVCVAVLVLETSTLAAHLATDEASLWSLAAGLVGFALWLGILARRHPHPRIGWGLVATSMDFAWVLGSAVLLAVAAPSLTATGIGLVVGVAVGVGAVGAVQLAGILALARETDPERGTSHGLTIDVEVDAPAPALWARVGDLGGISKYARNIATSRVDGEGEGAVRHCSDRSGQRWSEEVVDWQPGRAVGLRFAAEAPDFPFPMHRMIGGWRLTPLDGERTRVSVWWSFTPRRRGLGTLLVVLMDLLARADMKRCIQAMAAATRRV